MLTDHDVHVGARPRRRAPLASACAALALLSWVGCASEAAPAGQGGAGNGASQLDTAPNDPLPGDRASGPGSPAADPGGQDPLNAPVQMTTDPLAGDDVGRAVDNATDDDDDSGQAGNAAIDTAASAQALSELQAHLMLARDSRPPTAEQPFASVPLTRQDADAARDALWQALAAHIRATRMAEHQAKRITIGAETLRYETVVLGGEPPGGRDLFISMHGGGSGPASSNDSQWSNQISLAQSYAPVDTLWVAPRAPTDDWNMWFKDHIDGLFDRLISNMIVFEGIDPDRVYLNGYSAGGDGVYGLAPRTADRWAGAGMSAGHPNGASMANLRNVAFALHVGGEDSAFDRNTVGAEYIAKHMALQAADPDGYPFQGMVHPGLPHWMNLADGVSIPFMQGYTRNPVPERVVWEQNNEKTHARFYWLALDPEQERGGTRVVVRHDDQTITIEENQGLSALRIRMSDAMLDMDQPISVVQDGTVLYEGPVSRTIAVLVSTLEEREDPSMAYTGEVPVTLSL